MTGTPQSANIDRIHALARSAMAQWGDSNSEPILIKHRENTVFKVQNIAGHQAVLRVHRAGYHDRDALESELLWMDMLSGRGFEVPVPITASNGQLLVEIKDPELGVRHLDMLSWMPGVPLGELGVPFTWSRAELKSIFYALGRCSGRLHRLSNAWTVPAGFRRHSWDLEGLIGESPFWGPFWTLPELSVEQSRVLSETRHLARAKLTDYQNQGGGFGLIHADLVRENVLVDGDHVRLIDFDDAGYGWHMFEIATILQKNRFEPDYPLIEEAVLQGYGSEMPLRDLDLQVLPMFFALRSLTYLGWLDARRSEPGIQQKIAPHIQDAEELCRQFLESC